MKKSKLFKILNLIKNVLCWGLIFVFVSVIIFFLVTKINSGTPSLFGYSIYRVSSGSMEPELMIGDVILSKNISDPENIKVDEVVTYEGEGELSGLLVTHKVIKAPYADGGITKIQTQGVANDLPDQPISVDRVCGVMVCKIPVLDVVYSVFLSHWGLLIVICLLVFIFIDEIINIVRILSGHDKTAKDGEDINDIIERLQNENTED